MGWARMIGWERTGWDGMPWDGLHPGRGGTGHVVVILVFLRFLFLVLGRFLVLDRYLNLMCVQIVGLGGANLRRTAHGVADCEGERGDGALRTRRPRHDVLSWTCPVRIHGVYRTASSYRGFM